MKKLIDCLLGSCRMQAKEYAPKKTTEIVGLVIFCLIVGALMVMFL